MPVGFGIRFDGTIFLFRCEACHGGERRHQGGEAKGRSFDLLVGAIRVLQDRWAVDVRDACFGVSASKDFERWHAHKFWSRIWETLLQ